MAERKQSIAVCLALCIGISFTAGVALLIVGNILYQPVSEYYENGTQSKCKLIDYRFENCTYYAAKSSYQSTKIILIASAADECGNNATLNSDLIECNEDSVDSIDEYQYEIGSEYDCWITDCEEGKYTLEDVNTIANNGIIMLVFGSVCIFIVFIAYCYGIYYTVKTYND